MGNGVDSLSLSSQLCSILSMSKAERNSTHFNSCTDPDAEVVSLSPKTLLESDRYVCEICNQGFQRDQNLQMHRRRHKVPWKLLKRESPEVSKRVFVCPEPSCLHHDSGGVGFKRRRRSRRGSRAAQENPLDGGKVKESPGLRI
ncbi:unnamed protein product [Camellia sinensis]